MYLQASSRDYGVTVAVVPQQVSDYGMVHAPYMAVEWGENTRINLKLDEVEELCAALTEQIRHIRQAHGEFVASYGEPNELGIVHVRADA